MIDTVSPSLSLSLCLTSCLRTLLEQTGHWQGFQALVNMILSSTAIPGHYPVDETSSSLTLTFWYTLQVRPWILDVRDLILNLNS